MKPLTIGKKKKTNPISKGAKIGATVGGLSGVLAKSPVGGRIGGTAASALGGAVIGSAIGAGVKAIKGKKKAKFSSNELVSEFKSETNLIGTFPSNENTVKSKKKKSVIDEAKEVVTNKDQLPQKVKGKLKDK